MNQSVMTQPSSRATILVVDDTEANLDLLVDLLSDAHDIMVASDGESALETAFEFPPDLILLDVLMPEPDGYEVCRRLKAHEATSRIPIIFITALGDEEDEAKGLALGAADYIIKPLKPAIVRARVKTQLALLQAMRELEKQNEILLENQTLRDDVERITRHDLKGPLNGIIGLPQLIAEDDNITAEQRELLSVIEQSGWRLLRMINLSLDLYRMEKGTYELQAEPLNLVKVLRTVLEDLKSKGFVSRVHVRLAINGRDALREDEVPILGEELLCYSLFANLITNAFEASQQGDGVEINITPGPEVAVAIHNAQHVPAAVQACFFDKYATWGKKTGTGLGTYSAKLIADRHGGRVSLDSSEEAGTTVTVVLPARS